MKMIKSIPALPVQSIKTAAEFYKTKFGFTISYQDENFARLNRDDVEIHLWASFDESWKNRVNDLIKAPIKSGAESFLAGTASCRIEVEGIDKLYKEYKKQGVLYNSSTVVTEQPWSTREFEALDLHRNLLVFYELINNE